MPKEKLAKHYIVVDGPIGGAFFTEEDADTAAGERLNEKDAQQIFIYRLVRSFYKDVQVEVKEAPVGDHEPSIGEIEDLGIRHPGIDPGVRDRLDQDAANGVERRQEPNEPFDPRVHPNRRFPDPPLMPQVPAQRVGRRNAGPGLRPLGFNNNDLLMAARQAIVPPVPQPIWPEPPEQQDQDFDHANR